MGDLAAAWQAAQRATAYGVPESAVAYRAGVIATALGEREASDALLRRALAGETELSPAQVRRARVLLAGALVTPTTRTDCEDMRGVVD